MRAFDSKARRASHRARAATLAKAAAGIVATAGTLVAFGGSVASAAPAPTSNPLTIGHSYRHGVVPSRSWLHVHPQFQSQNLSANDLSYGGGVDSVGVTTGLEKVYLVFWGNQWGAQSHNSAGNLVLSGDPDGVAPDLQAFFRGLGTGGERWSGVMTQYCQGVATGAQSCGPGDAHVAYPSGGALAGVWEDTSSAAPDAASGNEIGAEAVAAAQHFGNLTASSKRNAQYVVVSPTGTNPDNYQTAGFCAWHDWTGDSGLTGGAVSSPVGDLAFTNLPYIPDAGASCGENFVNPGGLLDGVTIVEGHEYAETITDQFPAGGWTDSSGAENGDKCAWISSGTGAAFNLSLTTGTFAVQSTWANDANLGAGGCEGSHSIVYDHNTIVVTNPGSQTNTIGDTVGLQMGATDSQSGQILTWSASGLPTGLSINTSTGLITGTATTVGSFNATVTATDTGSSSGFTSFTWVVDPINPPTITTQFGAGSIPLGGSTSVSFTLTNPNSAGLTGLAFTGTLSSGLVVSSPVGLSNSCNGTVSAASGGATISLGGGSLIGGATCTVSVNVDGVAAGSQDSSTTNVTSVEGGTGNSASTSILVAEPPSIATQFGSATVGVGGSTALSFTIANPNGAGELTGVGFTDTLPSGLEISSPNGLTGSCGGGTITATAGGSAISLSGGALPPGSSCTFSVNVTGVTAGDDTNTTSPVVSNEGGTGNTATASITVIAAPTLALGFGSASTVLGGTTNLTFTVANPNAGTALTGVAFGDTLPAGLVVATPNGLTGSCGGGTITAAAGSTGISLSGATLAAGASCSFSVAVKTIAPGPQVDSAFATSDNGGQSGTAAATLNVTFSAPCITGTKSSLVIGAGTATCISAGATIKGSITVNGGALWVTGGSLGGGLTSTGSTLIHVCGASLNGGISITGSTGRVTLGGVGCSGNKISGSVMVTGNQGGGSVVGNTIGGSLTVTNNQGGWAVGPNKVSGTVTVKNNT